MKEPIEAIEFHLAQDTKPDRNSKTKDEFWLKSRSNENKRKLKRTAIPPALEQNETNQLNPREASTAEEG